MQAVRRPNCISMAPECWSETVVLPAYFADDFLVVVLSPLKMHRNYFTGPRLCFARN